MASLSLQEENSNQEKLKEVEFLGEMIDELYKQVHNTIMVSPINKVKLNKEMVLFEEARIKRDKLKKEI